MGVGGRIRHSKYSQILSTMPRLPWPHVEANDAMATGPCLRAMEEIQQPAPGLCSAMGTPIMLQIRSRTSNI